MATSALHPATVVFEPERAGDAGADPGIIEELGELLLGASLADGRESGRPAEQHHRLLFYHHH